MAAKSKGNIVLSQEEAERYRRFREEEEKREELELQSERERDGVITLLDMALYLPRMALVSLNHLMETLGPIGYAEFQRILGIYSQDSGLYVMKPYDQEMSANVLVLRGETKLSPKKHINPTSPFGCIAYHPIQITEKVMTTEKRKEIKRVVEAYVATLYNAEKPSVASWVATTLNTATDAKPWKEFLPNTNASIGLYQNKGKSSYMLMVNSHLGDAIHGELSAMIAAQNLTAAEFGVHPIPQYLRNLSVRNVGRIMAEILTLLSDASLIVRPSMIESDTHALEEEHAEPPHMLVPQGMLTYNDFVWLPTRNMLCFFYNLSGGFTGLFASTPMLHQILMGPYKQGFKVFEDANRVSRSRATDFIHGHPISTGTSKTKKLKTSKNKVISVSKRTKMDMNPFEATDKDYLTRLYHNDLQMITKEDIVKTYSTIFVFIP